MKIEIQKILIELPNWTWWQYLLLVAGITLIIKGDYQTLFDWIRIIIKK